jgi:thiol-disulfide isomerase/thioredoxin
MRNLYSRLRYIVTLAICLGVAVGHVSAADTNPDTDGEGRLFQPSLNPVANVQRALDRAAADNRLALVVLGANWCHDSRALASRLHSPPLAELVQQHYELVFVDAGFLDKGRAVMQQFGVAHYYATPTVLIIDPSSGQVINNEDRHQWSNAYKIDMSTSVRYFEKWLKDAPDADSVEEPVVDSAELRRLYAEIDEFEQHLANRVAAGYAVVGPLLEAYDAGNAPEEFDARWNELRDFRVAIPGDIRELRDDARRRVSSGDPDIQILFPNYPLLSWESID